MDTLHLDRMIMAELFWGARDPMENCFLSIPDHTSSFSSAKRRFPLHINLFNRKPDFGDLWKEVNYWDFDVEQVLREEAGNS